MSNPTEQDKNPSNSTPLEQDKELRAKIDTALSPIEELLFPTGYEEAEYGDPTEAMDNSMALGSALEKLEALIQAHTNAEIAKVLDRAKQRFHEPIEHDGSYISISVIDKTFDELIQAERAKLKEKINDGEEQNNHNCSWA